MDEDTMEQAYEQAWHKAMAVYAEACNVAKLAHDEASRGNRIWVAEQALGAALNEAFEVYSTAKDRLQNVIHV